MRFLSLRQQLLFSPDTARASRPQPLMTRTGKAGRAAVPPAMTGRRESDGAGAATADVGAPVIPVRWVKVDNSPQVSQGEEHLRSLFEAAGTAILMALFLAAAIFA